MTVQKKKRKKMSFNAKSLALARTHMWREEFLPLLFQYLELRPGQTVVDVGCGTGFFTRLAARGLKNQGTVIGVDRDRRLISVARKLTEAESPNNIVTFRKADAKHLPFPDDFADRVICQTLLCIPDDPRAIAREMIRICKPGGMVGAVEGAFDSIMWYIPYDRRLTELLRKKVAAENHGYQRVYGSDRGIAYKLPDIFRAEGLTRVRLDGYAHVWLEGDDRIPPEFKMELHKEELRGPSTTDDHEDVLRRGGMRKNELEELQERLQKFHRRFVEKPQLLETDASTNSRIFFITTGVKNQL